MHLARACKQPLTLPLPPPSVSATLYCAFAAEAYVNVALLRTLGEVEYRALSKIPVRSKYYLVTRLGAREVWFSSGEQVLEDLEELFSQRNRLAHAQPDGSVVHPFSDPEEPDLHTDLTNVARWLASTIDAVLRLGRSHGDLAEFTRAAAPLSELEPMLRAFEPSRDGARLEKAVRSLLADLLREDEGELLTDDELDDLVRLQDPDWDLRDLQSDSP